MSLQKGVAFSDVSLESDKMSPRFDLKDFRQTSKDSGPFQYETNESTTDDMNTNSRKICLIAKLQSVFFPMKLFGLFFQDMRGACQLDSSLSGTASVFLTRSYQCLVLLILWLNFGKTLASFWVDNPHGDITGVELVVPAFLWFLQTALQASICFFTMHMTSKKSALKSLLTYWNSQPNFDELVAESYMIKCIKRTLMVAFVLMVLNTVLYGLILFLPSESIQPLSKALVSPLPPNTAAKAFCFVVFLYCSAAWLMPFAIYSAVCLTLIHQCRRLRKTLRLTASANEVRRVKILRQQHSSLCGSVRKVDNLFKFFTLVVYVTNIPLLCILFFHLLFVKSSSVITQVTLSFWFVTVAFMMVGVSFLGAQLNSRVSIDWLTLVCCAALHAREKKRASFDRAREIPREREPLHLCNYATISGFPQEGVPGNPRWFAQIPNQTSPNNTGWGAQELGQTPVHDG